MLPTTNLHPAFAPHAAELWNAAASTPLDLVLVYAWRDPAVQARLYAQGRTLPGKIVTYAPPGESPHNATLGGKPASLAIDVAPRAVLRLKDWAPDDPAWVALGELVATFPALEWGGNWPSRKRDRPHVQMRNWRTFISPEAA